MYINKTVRTKYSIENEQKYLYPHDRRSERVLFVAAQFGILWSLHNAYSTTTNIVANANNFQSILNII
jgi:hypothetical protein